MTLEASVGVRAGALDLDAELVARPGEVTALVGANGAGKSTVLRAIAGLVAVSRGSVRLDGAVLEDAAAGIRLPPERRRIGVVFQDGLLFPHLSAVDNVAFGLRGNGVSRAEAGRRATDWLGRLGLDDVARLRPGALSGGQAQRVALARALAPQPRLLLLDEPLSALDQAARVEVRRALRSELARFGGCCVLVTHEPHEALGLTSHLVVLEGGRVVQAGTPQEVAARPRSSYVADLVGVNLLSARGDGGQVVLDSGAALLVPARTEGRVLVVIHPRAVGLYRSRPEGSPRNVWLARVEDIDPEGELVRVRLGGDTPVVAELTRAAREELALVPGAEVWASVKATEIAVYPT